MKKWQKVLLGIGIGLIALAIAGIVVCLIVFPTQSKEYYERFKELLTQPLPVIGISALVLIGGVLAILSRTSFGRKVLSELTDKTNQLTKDYNAKIEEVKEFTQKANIELQEYKKEGDFYKEIILEICNTVPNKKVKDIAGKINTYTSDEYLAEQMNLIKAVFSDNKEEFDKSYQNFINEWENLESEQKIQVLATYEEIKKEYEQLNAKKQEIEQEIEQVKIDTLNDFKNRYNAWEWKAFVEKLLQVEKLWQQKSN